MISLCVVIKIYNEYEMLADCITSLNGQMLQPKKIIVADDGSPHPNVQNEVNQLRQEFPELNIQLLKLPLKLEPNLDTVGRTWKEAWILLKESEDFTYFAMLDVDTRLEANYYDIIIQEMEKNPLLGCVSGTIKIRDVRGDYIEEINVGAKFGRRNARGSGKVIRTSLLRDISDNEFPAVDWDTWINTKVKVKGYKCPQIDNIFMYQERPTTRVAGKDLYRNGRLTYHFGYNPLLLLIKMIIAKKGALEMFRGYLKARKANWKLEDEEVRKYFGWRFFLHF